MGAEQSTPDVAQARAEQFILMVTAPAGVGKEGLMGRFISENTGTVGYCAKAGSVSATEKGLLYFYETLDDPHAPPSCPDSYPTVSAAIAAVLRSGRSCVADVDTAGVRALREARTPGCFVFVVPPSLDALHATLERAFAGRPDGARKAAEMGRHAEEEINALREEGLYDFAVVNEDEGTAMAELQQCVAKRGRIQQPGAAVSPRQQDVAPPEPVPEPPSEDVSGEAQAEIAAEKMEVVVPPGMAKWAGKVALVTGASSGIGWSLCEALALAGMRVVAIARRQEKLEALQRHVLKHGINGQMFLPVVCDITKEAEVKTLNKLVAKQFGGRHVSVLINNAGVGSSHASIMDGDSVAWVAMCSTNILGVAMCCREVCQAMKGAGEWGHIINVSSMSGHRVPAGGGAGGFYAATKHAVRAMTEGLRQEARALGVPLRVSCISPGVVHTDFFKSMSGNDAAVVDKYESAPGLSAYDVANTALFMLSAPLHMEVGDVLMRPTHQVV